MGSPVDDGHEFLDLGHRIGGWWGPDEPAGRAPLRNVPQTGRIEASPQYTSTWSNTEKKLPTPGHPHGVASAAVVRWTE